MIAGAITAAIALAAHRWFMLPVAAGGKAPLTPHGWHDATRDPAVIERWPAAVNVGVACKPSGLVVVDVDPRNGGDDALHALEREFGDLPDTVGCLTGGGGQHTYFHDPGVELRGELAPGVELKHCGYVLVPPSRTTGRYEWACDRGPGEVELAAVPPSWLAAMRAPERRPPVTHESAHGGDPLKAIAARDYVPMLTGRAVGRDGKARCPFHSGGDERTPSLHAYSEPERGWYCFGCRRGGGIYQFAAIVAGYELPLRGVPFLAVRDALDDVFA